MDERMNGLWDLMVELGVATNEELGLAVALCGNTIYTLQTVLYIRTGFRNEEQLLEDLGCTEEDEG